MRYARIENGAVAEFFTTDEDILMLFAPELVWVPAPDLTVKEGWLYDGSTFSAPPVVDGRPQVWEEFRTRRDLFLSRLADIAGRFQRRGNVPVPPACDNIAEGLLAMPQDAALLALPDAESLRAGIVAAANNLLRAQLTDPTTAPMIKTALDKVFK